MELHLKPLKKRRSRYYSSGLPGVENIPLNLFKLKVIIYQKGLQWVTLYHVPNFNKIEINPVLMTTVVITQFNSHSGVVNSTEYSTN